MSSVARSSGTSDSGGSSETVALHSDSGGSSGTSSTGGSGGAK